MEDAVEIEREVHRRGAALHAEIPFRLRADFAEVAAAGMMQGNPRIPKSATTRETPVQCWASHLVRYVISADCSGAQVWPAFCCGFGLAGFARYNHRIGTSETANFSLSGKDESLLPTFEAAVANFSRTVTRLTARQRKDDDYMTCKTSACEEPGFLLHRHSTDLTLFLPAPLAAEMSHAVANQQSRERDLARRHSDGFESLQAVRARTDPDQEIVNAVRELCDDPHPVHDPCSEHQIYSVSELEKLAARLDRLTDRDQKEVLRRYLRQFVTSGLLRTIARPQRIERLDAVARLCPNFSSVVEIVRGELKAAAAALRPPQIPPLLLLGPPGIGKTHFCRVLATHMAAPHHKLSFDSAVASTALTGVDPQWGTAKSGLLLEAICAGAFANPVIVLDELDKCIRSRSDDALAPLHTLLERSSAGRFRDIFADVEFDTSIVTWIATANDADAIPDTLRSRCTEVTIEPPTAYEAIVQATAIAREVVVREAPSGFAPVDKRLCVSLAHLTPREVQKAVRGAIRRAVDNDRQSLEPHDFPREILREAAHDPAASTWLH